ncbi:MAG: comEA [Clostridiales bacterium]|nr:comEA [Clostridiales bacterium]
MQNTTTMSNNVNNNGVNNEGNNGSSSFEETSNEKPNVSQTEEVFKEISIININTATSEELQTLKGIGPSKAQAIIDYRNSKGNFNDITEIVNVSGIGDKTFERIKEYITSGKD